MNKALHEYSVRELEDELHRRVMRPTEAEKEAERKQRKQALLERLYREEPKKPCNLWEIKAEDENPDMGGHHYQKRLAVVRGSYRKACEYAVNLKGFTSWGYGGNVVPIEQHEFIDLEEET